LLFTINGGILSVKPENFSYIDLFKQYPVFHLKNQPSMKKIYTFILAGLAVFVLATSGVHAQSPDDYRDVIQKNNQLMKEAMVGGKTEIYQELYAADVISMPNNSKMLEGLDARLKSNEEMFNSGWKVTEFESKIFKVIPSGKLITEIGSFSISFKGPDMEKPFVETGNYVTIWEDQGDMQLRIKYEIWNSDTTPSK